VSAERTGNTGELESLSRRAVACKHWRWLPGMLTTDGLRILEGGTHYVIGYKFGETRRGGGLFDGESTGLLPDLTDPATLGCVLALVREAFPTAPATTSRHSSWEMSRGHYYFWIVSFCTGKKWDQSSGQTEAAALVAALEAAP